MKAIYKILLEKATVAMKSAVTIYNNPSLRFKTEMYIVNAIIAWTYLFHAYYDKLGINYYYFTKTKAGRKKYEKVDNRKKTWDILRCMNANECPLSNAQQKNLELLIRLRNKIEHTSINDVDDLVSPQILACSINFNSIIKNLFGDKYSLDKELGMAIQFSNLNPYQKRTIKTKSNKSVLRFIAEFESSMDKSISSSDEYSFRVAFIPITVNKESQANAAITFLKTNEPVTESMNMIIKETEKPKFKPGEIVRKMKEKGFSSFSINKHTDLWKDKDAKNPDYHYGTVVSGTWYWYEKWVDVVEDELTKTQLEDKI